MQRAKHDCIYGSLEFEFDEQFVRCNLNNNRPRQKFIIYESASFCPVGNCCPFYSRELSRQEDCRNYDRVSQCTMQP